MKKILFIKWLLIFILPTMVIFSQITPSKVYKKPGNAKQHFVSIPGASFEKQNFPFVNRDEGCLIFDDFEGDLSAHRFFAELQLPDEAVITGILVHIMDTNSVADFECRIMRNGTPSTANEQTQELIGTVSSNGINQNFTMFEANVTSPFNRIDNENFTYFLESTQYQKMKLGRVTITYSDKINNVNL